MKPGRQTSRPTIDNFHDGNHIIDEPGNNFLGSDRFVKVESSGWIDAWRTLNGDAREFRWHSKLRGGQVSDGFRIDHAFVTPSLASRVQRCWYSHTEREAKTSGHSVLLIEISPPGAV